MKINKKVIGVKGEKIATKFLKKKKYKIIEKNFTSRFGEIDIIGLEKNTIVFVEVKFRQGKQFGTSEESMTYRKKKRLIKSAKYFLLCNPEYSKYDIRFDGVFIDYNKSKKNYKISLIKNMFSADI